MRALRDGVSYRAMTKPILSFVSSRLLRMASVAASVIASAVGCSGNNANVAALAPPHATEPGACRPSPASGASLEVVVLGSGGPVPSGRACASHVVLIEGVPRVLVDAGPGSAVRFGEAGLAAQALDTILLTHLHVDHAGDLPGVVKARDLAQDVPLAFLIAGPDGRGEYPPTSKLVDALLGTHGAFPYLRGFRNDLELNTRDLPIARDGSVHVVIDAKDVRITAVATDHGDAPAIAYRIDHGGRSVVFGGDTALTGDAVTKLARGADLFVANATVVEDGAPPGLYKLHAPPRRIAEVARDAGVRSVVLAHLGDVVIEREASVLASMRAVAALDVRLAHDCLRIPLAGASAPSSHAGRR